MGRAATSARCYQGWFIEAFTITSTLGMDSDRFDRLEALLSAKLDAQTQQVAELQKEVALLRTAVQANAGASTAPIMQQAAAQLAPPLRSSKRAARPAPAMPFSAPR